MLSVLPSEFVIAARSEYGLELVFRPLIARTDNTKVVIKSPELGEYLCPLKLTGTPVVSSRNLTFKCSIGGEVTQTFKFMHYCKKTNNYSYRVEQFGNKETIDTTPNNTPVCGKAA